MSANNASWIKYLGKWSSQSNIRFCQNDVKMTSLITKLPPYIRRQALIANSFWDNFHNFKFRIVFKVHCQPTGINVSYKNLDTAMGMLALDTQRKCSGQVY
jgi:hypothetical protein